MGGPSVKLSSGILFRTESRWAELAAGSMCSLLLSKASALGFCGVCCVCGFVGFCLDFLFCFVFLLGGGNGQSKGTKEVSGCKQASLHPKKRDLKV